MEVKIQSTGWLFYILQEHININISSLTTFIPDKTNYLTHSRDLNASYTELKKICKQCNDLESFLGIIEQPSVTILWTKPLTLWLFSVNASYLYT